MRQKSKQNRLFDYTKLKKAIPKIWFSDLTKKETERVYYIYPLGIPYLKFGRVSLPISDVSNKRFYNLKSFKHTFNNNRCCLFWENILQRNIDWSSVFKRNLACTREHRLREFKCKLLYNILPVRNNLYKWGLADDRYCPKCHGIEDIVRVFIECEQYKNFFDYIKHVVKYTFNIDFVMDIDKEIDVVTTIAFWCIYKMLVTRNKYGI